MTLFPTYVQKLTSILNDRDWSDVQKLADALTEAALLGRNVFICGNGGSAANAIHFANDLLCGTALHGGRGLKVQALSANQAVMTCFANDIGYDQIYSQQLEVLANPGDICLVFSGSGNSPNIVKALEKSREMGLTSFAILGYSGGAALRLADIPIYFPIDDMQIAEDCQLIVGHMLMQYLVAELKKRGPTSDLTKPHPDQLLV